MNNKIVVYTGSFNPLTKGHLLVMEAAMKEVNADNGIFFITPNKYLTRKMIFKTNPSTSFILPEETRKEMIESLTSDYNISYGGKEVGSASPSTSKTIKSVLRKNKNSEVYCLIGADKLPKLHKWDEIDSLINNIKFIVAVRKDFDIDKLINDNPWLRERKDRLIIINPDPLALDISSSEVRRRFFAGEDFSSLMDKEPHNIMKRFKVGDFPLISNEDLIKYEMSNGRFGPARARELVYKCNKDLFDNWDESLLGDKLSQLNNTKVYKEKFEVKVNHCYDTITDCVNKDCADVALDLINDGYNPAILNLASNTSPGGGYHKGTSAQEECLCQMSTLSLTLYQFGDPSYKQIREASVKHKEIVYPLNINFGGIYSPNVTFFRHGKDKYYSLRDKTFSCSIITVASLSNREKNNYTNDERIYFNFDGTLTEEGKLIESNKIRTIYRIALDNGHDSLVLGAFGCGVYRLLPSEISRLFYDILNEPEFKDKFKKIVFAILEGKENSKKKVGVNGKFKPFYDIYK